MSTPNSHPPAPSPTSSAPTSPTPRPTTVLVCTQCRRDGDADDGPRSGALLHDALVAAAQGRADVRVVGVECLSVCKRPITVGFADAGKWSYVYGDFAPEAAEDILATAALYGDAPDGLIPWRSRPVAFRKGVVARIPPFSPVPEVTA